MKIKNIKFAFLILCIFIFSGFNYASLAATTGSKTSNTADSDNDGLSNNEEALYGTDPGNPDTDGDGYSDGVEVKSGYNPLKPAPGDKIVIEKTTLSSFQPTSSTISLTDSFNSDFQSYIASKKGQSVSATEVKSFIDSELAGKLSTTDISTIPSTDRSQLRIKPQTYSSLTAAEKKLKIQEDAADYLNQIIYLLISNAPTPIASSDDLEAFQQDFIARLNNLSDPDNSAYFIDMGNRFETFSQQYNALEVPETMVDLHIKFSQLINGILTLRNPASSNDETDPMGKMVTLTKAKDLIELFNNFMQNDLQNYFKQITAN